MRLLVVEDRRIYVILLSANSNQRDMELMPAIPVRMPRII